MSGRARVRAVRLGLVGSASVLLTLIAVTGCTSGQRATARDPVGAEVKLDSGRIRGVDEGDVLRYRGIPYAQPPTGNLRWSPPRPVTAWKGVKDATKSGKPCAQAGSSPKTKSVNEDCLHVDVTVPKRPEKPGKAKPVMVWLHGGGFSEGSGPEYDPRRLAVRGDVVVVTVDFRLGVLGNMSLPQMTDGGSYGLQDQQAALKWVRANAAVFGGDPHNVTLFGESGGSIAACGQLTSPGSKGLFDKAILQSGTCATSLRANAAGPGSPPVSFWVPQADVVAETRRAGKKLGCSTDVLRCMRALPVDKLLTESVHFTGAAVGGATLPVNPAQAVERGRFHRLPILSGHTSSEALLFAGVAGLLGEPINDANLHAWVLQGFGEETSQVERAYPRKKYRTAAEAWAAPNTDAMFACPHYDTDAAFAQHTTVHAYEFADRTAPPLIPSLPGFPAGAGHGSELAYLFDMKGKPIGIDGKPLPLNAAQKKTAAEMVAAWTAFAHTSDPSVPGINWPAWTPKNRHIQEFGGTGPTHHCDLWN